MKKTSRLLIALASLAIAGVFFVPLWSIYLFAPQYPEGLTMHIWVNKLTGEMDIINGLNHYIGMAHITEDMFPELQAIPWFVAGYILFGLVVALVGRLRLLEWFVAACAAGGIVALWDFWRWEYSYGHNLDPMAPIKVPGVGFQPPLIGYKKLLNFEVYSLPDVGGWLVIGGVALIVLVLVWELFFRKKTGQQAPLADSHDQVKTANTLSEKTKVAAGGLLLLTFISSACSIEPQPVRYGQDECAHCRMSILEPKFSAELLTKKGRAFKFDDVSCLVAFLKTGTVAEADIHSLLVSNYAQPGEWLDAKTAFYLQSPDFKSPMAGNVAAFKDKAAVGGSPPANAEEKDWEAVKEIF